MTRAERDELAKVRARAGFKVRKVEDLPEREERLAAYEAFLERLRASIAERRAARFVVAEDVPQPRPSEGARYRSVEVGVARNRAYDVLRALDDDVVVLADDDPHDPVMQSTFVHAGARFRMTTSFAPRPAGLASSHVLRTGASESHPRFSCVREGTRPFRPFGGGVEIVIGDPSFDPIFYVTSDEPFSPDVVRRRVAAALGGVSRTALRAGAGWLSELRSAPRAVEVSFVAPLDRALLRTFVDALFAIRAAHVPLAADFDR